MRELVVQQDLRREFSRQMEALIQEEAKERTFREETQADLERQDQKIAELETRVRKNHSYY